MKSGKYIKTNISYYLNEQSYNTNDNFLKWFGNSKVTKNGKPLICYHGSRSIFDIFTPSKSIGNQGETDQIEGIYFTDNKDGASFFALVDDDKYIIAAYISIQNPYIINDYKTLKSNLNINKLSDVNKRLIDMGYDGLIIKKGYQAYGEYCLYLAFYPNQIKSINNNGDWSLDNANIYM